MQQNEARMNHQAARPAVQRLGLPVEKLQSRSGIGQGLLWFAQDDAVDTDAPRRYPLLGAFLWRVRKSFEQPFQQSLHSMVAGRRACFFSAWCDLSSSIRFFARR